MQELDSHGFVVHAHVLAPELAAPLRDLFAAAVGERPGARGGLDAEPVRALARSAAVRALVEPVLGRAAFAFRATLFDKRGGAKGQAANWLVPWHQDLVVPVVERVDAPGFGPWSVKGDDGVFVQPPVEVLAELLAVRVDLDGSRSANGGLRVLPGTHRDGVLSRDAVAAHAAERAPVAPDVPAGGALVLRPLLLHASSRAADAGGVGSHRRVVHLEFAPHPLPGGVRFRSTVH